MGDRLVWGQYNRRGEPIQNRCHSRGYIKNDRSIPLKADVANEKEIPAAIDRLAESIRGQLDLSSRVLKELKATSFQPTTQSVAAMRAYNQGLVFQRDGKNLDAQKQFDAATKEDPNFALAFSRLAQTYANLGTTAKQSSLRKKL